MSDATPQDVRFEEREPYEKGFSAYFDETIRPVLLDLERERLQTVHEMDRRRPIAIAATIVFAIVLGAYLALILHTDNDPRFAFVMAFFVWGMAWVWQRSPGFSFSLEQKTRILPLVGGFFGLQYRETSTIQPDVIRASLVVPLGPVDPRPDDVTSTDYLWGMYENIEVGITDLMIARGSGRSRSVVFDGLFIAAKMPKPFIGITFVTRQGEGYGKTLAAQKGMTRVELEDPTFEKIFDVYGTDQVEARYLLTPDIMERLVDLSNIYDRIVPRCAFVGQTVYVGIPTPKIFFSTVNVHTSALQTEEIRRYLRHIHVIFSIVDILKLNHRVGFQIEAADALPTSID